MFDTLTESESESESGSGSKAARGSPRSAGASSPRAVGALGDLMERLAQVDVHGMDDVSLMALVEELTTCRSVVEGVRARAIGELDQRDATDQAEGLRTASWLAHAAHDDRRQAGRDVRVAATLRDHLPEVGCALESGQITPAHASALVRAANPRIRGMIAELQERLIGRAVEVSYRKWKAELDHLVELLDEDGGHDPDRERRGPKLSVTQLFDGAFAMRADLGHDDGVLVEAAIDEVADELFRQCVKDREIDPSARMPNRTQLRALALVELCRRGRAVDISSSVPPRPEVVIVCRPSIGVHVDASDPDTDARADPAVRTLTDPFSEVLVGRCTREGARRFRFDASSALLADPRWRVAHQRNDGRVLSIAAAGRCASPAQRRALELRDGGCVVPGCDAPPRWCDAHHVTEAQHGGATTMGNLVLLCRHHHGVMHRKGWQMTIDADERVRWRTPTGEERWGQRHGESTAPPGDYQPIP